MASWYTPPPFNPIQYVPPSLKEQIRAKDVSLLRAVAHEVIPGPHPGGLTNHWCLYLQSGDMESVQIDMSPSDRSGTVVPGGTKGIIAVSLLRGLTSGSVERIDAVTTAPGLTVGHVIDLLAQHGREKYEFTPEGVGCRKWVTDTLKLLAEIQWLDQTAVSAATGDLKRLWPSGTPLELDAGQYY